MPAQIGLRRHHSRGEQALDLRGKEQPVALPRPVERRDAEAVAPEHELPPPFIPQRDRKLSAQPLEHPLLMLLPQVRDDLRVAMRVRAMPAAVSSARLSTWSKSSPLNTTDTLRSSFDIGCWPSARPDDAQPPRRQRQPRAQEEALLIRPAMEERPGHRLDGPLRNGSVPGRDR